MGDRDVMGVGPQAPEGMAPAVPGGTSKGVVCVSGAVWDRIEESRTRHNVLEHPFYVRWSAGELSSEILPAMRAVPARDRGAGPALSPDCGDGPEGRRDEIATHAGQEEAHVGLWDDFVEAGRRGDRRRADRRDGRVRDRLDGAGWLTSPSWPGCTRSRADSPRSRVSSATVSRASTASTVAPGSEYFRIHEGPTTPCRGVPQLIEEAMTPEARTPSCGRPNPRFVANWRLLDGVS